MSCGFDTGTYNLVYCTRDSNKNFSIKREVNAFLEIPTDDRVAFNMMKATSGVHILERKDIGVGYVLGEAAVGLGYTFDRDLRRPMKNGCLNPKEKDGQVILASMIHGMIETCKDGETLYYSIPSNALNEETDADFHSKLLERIFLDFEDADGHHLNPRPINEGLALVYAELAEKQWTGIGISFGAGMVNLCFAIFGSPVFSFSLVNSGDWIDKQAARATGESITFINREKLKLDLSKDADSLVQRAIQTEYEIMVQKTISGIKKGLEDSSLKVRTASGDVDIVIAGGTASPPGFENLVENIVKKSKLPINIGRIIKPKDPLYSVAKGCLIAAEAADVG